MNLNVGHLRFQLFLLLVMTCPLVGVEPVFAQGDPVLARDSIQIRAITWNTMGEARNPQWTPQVSFVLLGPIHNADVYWVEVGLPTKKKWLEMACASQGSNEYRAPEAELVCRLWNPDEAETSMFTVFVGSVNFSIHVRNELKGTNAVLFSGKAKLAKRPTPDRQEATTWHVDEDWRLPIGYLYVRKDKLHAVMTFRESVGHTTYYLLAGGAELSQCEWTRGIEANLSIVRVEMCSLKIPSKQVPTATDVKYVLNPGEYEIKVMADGKLVRSAKLTISADGTLDNSISTANNLGSDRVIVPVTVLGAADGSWNKLAWKTDALYGNPLTGFAVGP